MIAEERIIPERAFGFEAQARRDAVSHEQNCVLIHGFIPCRYDMALHRGVWIETTGYTRGSAIYKWLVIEYAKKKNNQVYPVY